MQMRFVFFYDFISIKTVPVIFRVAICFLTVYINGKFGNKP